MNPERSLSLALLILAQDLDRKLYPLAGVVRRGAQLLAEVESRDVPDVGECRPCGGAVERAPRGRTKVYCSARCRRRAWRDETRDESLPIPPPLLSSLLLGEGGRVTAERVAAILLIVGSTVFGIGAAVGVPGVFAQRDPQVRLRMLTERLRAWQVAQPLYGAGPVIAAAGVAFLAAASHEASRAVLEASCAALAVGALAWGWSLYLRGTRVSEFAFGTLPGWPFAT